MIQTRFVTIFCFVVFMTSCASKEDTIRALRSDDKNKIMEACDDLGNISDTQFVSVLLEDPYDPRVSLRLGHYGLSVHYCKMLALKRISKLLPPKKIDQFHVDSSIVDFYRNWAIREGYVK